MYKSFLFSQSKLLRLSFYCSFTLVLLFIGCKEQVNEEQPSEQSTAQQNALVSEQTPVFPKFSSEISALDKTSLEKLGVKNDIPTEFVIPGAYFVQAIYPDNLKKIEQGTIALDFFAQSVLQLPVPNVLENASLALYSKGYTFEVLKDAKTDAPIQEGFPSPVEAVYLKNPTEWNQTDLYDAVFKNIEQSQLKKEQIGSYEVTLFSKPLLMQLDTTGQAVGKIDNICAGIFFPSKDSVVFLSGSRPAIEAFCSAKSGDERGIAAQRIARAIVSDVAMVFQYDYNFDTPNAQLVQLPVPVTPDLQQVIAKYVSAFQIIIDVSKSDEAFLTLSINTKSPTGASELKKTIGTALMQGVDNLANILEKNGGQDPNNNIANLTTLLKAINLATSEECITATINNSPETIEFFAKELQNLNDLRANSETYAKYGLVEDSLNQFARAFTAYLGKNKVYPAPICAEDGTPLLSWRVALLPILGDQYKKLYDQFKLDEPWDSENNIKLLDQMPPIYAAPFNKTLKNKTQYLIFNTPETPFGRSPKGLRIQDLADPSTTFGVVLANENKAIEWTRPEVFAYNPNDPIETFGDFICGATLMGEVIVTKFENTDQTAKTLAALIFGAETNKVENSQDEASDQTDDVSSDKETDSDNVSE